MMRLEAWISLLFGLHTMVYSIVARRFVGNAELPLTEEERNRLLAKRPSLWLRVVGVCIGMVFCAYGLYSLWRR
jgi:hypothetical protein